MTIPAGSAALAALRPGPARTTPGTLGGIARAGGIAIGLARLLAAAAIVAPFQERFPLEIT
jgi:hypothetical protein